MDPLRMARTGRARDSSIDARILAAAERQLSVLGYEGMSLAAVAHEAATTRQALYRRWPTKAELAAAAVAALEEPTDRAPAEGSAENSGANDGAGTAAATGNPFGALVAELSDFQRGVSRPGRLSLVGTMLQETTEPDVLARYRGRVIAPRRRRIRTILESAQANDQIDADADLEVAVAMCTGGWYGRELAGGPVPTDWPRRTATLIWRALGGLPPETIPDDMQNAPG